MAKSGLFGKKLGMTQIFDESGVCIPVTILQVGPCAIVQIKSRSTDGYSAVQIGFEPIEEKKRNKPYLGHFKKKGLTPFRYLGEFRIPEEQNYEIGRRLDVNLFQVGDCIDITGTSKGKGFQGVIKRHGFSGGPGAHGSRFHRVPGSIGQCTTPGEVDKGRKLPGRMGSDRVKARNLKIVAIRSEENIVLAKGAVPGPNDGLIFMHLNEKLFEQRVKEMAPASQESKEKAVVTEENQGA